MSEKPKQWLVYIALPVVGGEEKGSEWTKENGAEGGSKNNPKEPESIHYQAPVYGDPASAIARAIKYARDKGVSLDRLEGVTVRTYQGVPVSDDEEAELSQQLEKGMTIPRAMRALDGFHYNKPLYYTDLKLKDVVLQAEKTHHPKLVEALIAFGFIFHFTEDESSSSR